MCELPGPIKSLLVICLFLIFIDIVEDTLRLYHRVATNWTLPSLISSTITFTIFTRTTYYYW